jgi:hypothetical protein
VRRSRLAAGWTVILLLVGAMTLSRFIESVPVRMAMNLAIIPAAALVAGGYALLSRARVRLHGIPLATAAIFAAAAGTFVLGGWWHIVPSGYLQAIVQLISYPMIVGLLLPSFLTGREILRMGCSAVAGNAVITAILAVPVFLGGRSPLAFYRVHKHFIVDALAIQLGVLALATLAATGARRGAGSAVMRRGRSLVTGLAVALAAASLPAFARGATVALMASLILMALAGVLGRRVAALGVHAVLLGSFALPWLVHVGAINETQGRILDPIIPDKWAMDATQNSSLVTRLRHESVFLSQIRWYDAIGSRRSLHVRGIYEAMGVWVDNPHNYWVQMILTVGWGGSLAMLAVWHWMVHLSANSPHPAGRWGMAWIMFLTMYGLTQPGAFVGLPPLALWCVMGGTLAFYRWRAPGARRQANRAPREGALSVGPAGVAPTGGS